MLQCSEIRWLHGLGLIGFNAGTADMGFLISVFGHRPAGAGRIVRGPAADIRAGHSSEASTRGQQLGLTGRWPMGRCRSAMLQ